MTQPSTLRPTPAAPPGRARHTGPAAAGRGPGRRPGFRPDIEGLRAVAVVAVVLYHVGVPGFGGGYVGVDVFFVLSGFLITGQLLRELRRTGRISLPAFYARRARRLLPASALVALATVAATALVESTDAARRTARDAVWAAFSAINYHLAASGTEYSNVGAEPSKLLHYWSLAVEEQYYLLWPVLLLGLAALAGRLGRRRSLLVPVVVAGLAVLAVGSLLLSAWQTPRSQPWAYFGLQTRAWELALGALVAAAAGRLERLPAPVAAGLSWAGVAAVLVAVVAYDDRTVFPGTAALLPVLGAAAAVAAGCRARPTGAAVVLSRRPLLAVGGLSYSLYLWHWPAVVLTPDVVTGIPPVLARLLGAVAALGLAALSLRLVENPVRTARRLAGPRRGLALGAALVSTVAAASLVASVALPVARGTGTPLAATGDVGTVRAALALQEAPRNLTPDPATADADRPASNADGCFATVPVATPQRPCAYGDPDGTRTMMLIGDSHADQWLPALRDVTAGGGWRILVRTKTNCPVVSVTVTTPHASGPYTACERFRADVFAEVARVRPDVVVTSQSMQPTAGAPGPQAWAAGVRTTLAALRPAGRVVFMQDTPNRNGKGGDCVAAHLHDLQACTTPLSATFNPGYTAVHDAVTAAFRAGGAAVVDLTPLFCQDGQCPTVIGPDLVYRDAGHISATYMHTIAPQLAATATFTSLLRPPG